MSELTKGKLLAKNTFWNLMGQGFPLAVALISFPILIKYLGTERFGILTLVWMITGYFNLFDLGLGRALTQLIAEKIGRNQEEEVGELIFISNLIMLALGTVAGIMICFLSHWLITSVLNISPKLQNETQASMYWVAFSIPFLISAIALKGALEAKQRFDIVNMIRIPLGSLSYLMPVATLLLSHELSYIVASLILSRILGFFIHLYYCKKVFPNLHFQYKIQIKKIIPLINFGGWMTVSNVISPIMNQMDRFFIGSITSMTMVAYYTTPYEMVSRLLVIPTAIVGVLFPAFSTSLVQNKRHTENLFNKGLKYILLSLFPVSVLIITLAKPGLTMWLPLGFSENSSLILQILCFSFLINSLAQIPYALIQAAGRPDLTAKLHMIELPIYLFFLWFFLQRFGVVGAALASLLRVVIDTIFLFLFSDKLLNQNNSRKFIKILFLLTLTLLGFYMVSEMASLIYQFIICVIFFVVFVSLCFKVWFTQEEVSFLTRTIFRKKP